MVVGALLAAFVAGGEMANASPFVDTKEGQVQVDHMTLQELQAAALTGSADAQNRLGVVFLLGLGVKADFVKAFEWFQKAAEKGHPDAETWLGNLYGTGRGVTLDRQKSLFWTRKAAERGYS
ncbi:tetratricopeptide repeat protein, partial [Mesorhizobium sp. M7A.F.Ca.AU.001.01.1.1]